MDRRKTILVIDDDPAITQVLCCALEEEYDVQVAFSGEEGLRCAEAVHPQLVLLDLHLPRLGGWPSCAACATRLGACPSSS